MAVQQRLIAKLVKYARTSNVWIPSVKKIGNAERMKNAWTRSVWIDLLARMILIAKTNRAASKESVDLTPTIKTPSDVTPKMIAMMIATA